jgi:peptidyl-Lys metalloendopeptidase
MSFFTKGRRFLVVGLFLLAALAAAVVPASAGVNGLSAAIATDTNFIDSGEDVTVRFTLRNDSDQDVYVLSWQTPLAGVESNLFDVRRAGKKVAYTGRLYKRATPAPQDYIRIAAGSSVSADVELSSVYDIDSSGEYSIRYRADLQDARTDHKALATGAVLESNAVFVGVERTEIDTLIADIAESVVAAPAPYLAPSYVSCSSTRQSTLVSALSNAESMSLRARNYLSGVPTASRPTDAAFRTWFGAYLASRYSTVQSHFNNIYSTFNTKRVTFYCDCSDSSYAYVYANRPYEIHLCNAFWNAPMTGTDSKAGTLIHEASHFSVVAGTQDYAYGQTACRSLATSNATRAVANADSHEYFAETR